VKGLYVQGAGYATGGWQTFFGDGKVGFVPVSPDAEVIASGSASLSGGRAAVSYEESFRAAIAAGVPVKVIITPTAECSGIMVSAKTATGFSVKELAGGISNATFDWIAFGRRKGFEVRPDIRPPSAGEARIETVRP